MKDSTEATGSGFVPDAGDPDDVAGVANGGGSASLPPPSPDFFSSPVFAERAISPEVAAARGYRPWNTSQELRDHFASNPHASPTFVRNVAHQSPTGVIIERSFRGIRLDDDPRFGVYLPELKPIGDANGRCVNGEKFEGIRPSSLRGDRRFYHAHPTGKRSFPPKLPNGKRLEMKSYHSADTMTKHIARAKFQGDHAGVNAEHVHWHLEDPAKYAFFPGKTAARLSVNPLAPWWGNVRRVYLGMEGCLKEDSMLSAIRTTGECSSVGSFASVTLWDLKAALDQLVSLCLFTPEEAPWRWDDEHQGITRVYRPSTAQIVLVPDADGYLNNSVRQQALFFRSRLRARRLDVVIAAPPIPVNVRAEGKEAVKAWLSTDGDKGVDDFLANGGKLSELEILHRELPTEAFDAWALEQKFIHGHRADRVSRDRRFLEGLALHGTDEGTFSGSLRALAAAVGLSKSAAYRAAEDLSKDGAFTLDRPLALAERSWEKRDNKTGKKTGEWVTTRDFFSEDRPTFTLQQDLRCPPDTFRPLGEPPVMTYEQESIEIQREILDEMKTMNRRLAEKETGETAQVVPLRAVSGERLE